MMLNFYTLDLAALVIILFIAFVLFVVLNHIDEQKDKNYVFNITASVVSGIFISVLYSYITIESDELLTANYWD